MNEERLARKKAYDKLWYQRNKEKNPEAFRERNRLKEAARRADPERAAKQRAWARENYAKKREAIRAREKAAYDANVNGRRDKALAYGRAQYANRNVVYRVRAAFGAARSRAKKRGIAFDLTLSDLGAPTCCAVTGIEFDMSRSFRQGNIFVPSLDRIDPTKGYTKGNVRFVCHGYNLAKHTGTDSDVLKLARALVKAFPE